MKANEAPKKIYLQVCGDCPQTDCENCKFEDLEDNVTWCKDRIFPKDVEYTRTDAFIEKAKKWIEEHEGLYEAFEPDSRTYYTDIETMVKDFENYMKGE